MSDRPFEIVQKIYNAVDTAESAWTAYKDSCIPEYDIAYEVHGTALKQSRLSITNRQEQGWKVLSLILGSALGAWVPKILNPFGNGIDNLTAGWVQATLKHIATEDLRDGIKGTTLDTMKKLGTADTGTAFEPVSEKTTRWGPRMGEGISSRAVQLKRAILQVQDAGRISAAAARKMEDAFRRCCPFVVDQPSQQDTASKQKFRNDSELQMWAEWALARNRKWWREHPQHHLLWDMYPIMNRMFALGVLYLHIRIQDIEHSQRDSVLRWSPSAQFLAEVVLRKIPEMSSAYPNPKCQRGIRILAKNPSLTCRVGISRPRNIGKLMWDCS